MNINGTLLVFVLIIQFTVLAATLIAMDRHTKMFERHLRDMDAQDLSNLEKWKALLTKI